MNDFKLLLFLDDSLLSVPFYVIDDMTFVSVIYNLKGFNCAEELLAQIHFDEDRLKVNFGKSVYCAFSAVVLVGFLDGLHFSA